MSVQSSHWFWFQGYPVQSGTRRITVPELVVTNDILKLERHVYWGFEDETRYIVVTRDPDLLRDDPDFSYRGDSKLFENRAMQVPAQFFSDYEGAAQGSTPVTEDLRFQDGQYRVFATTDELYSNDCCYLLKDEQARSNLSHNVTMVDGGLIDPVFGSQSLRDRDNIHVHSDKSWDGKASPSSVLEEWEFLDLSTNEVLIDEKTREWYHSTAFRYTVLPYPVDPATVEEREETLPDRFEMLRTAPERYTIENYIYDMRHGVLIDGSDLERAQDHGDDMNDN